MNAYILYRPNSEQERTVTDFVRDFTQQTQKEIELISLDTREGSEKARLYDIVRYPAVFVVDEAGSLLKFWQGEMPLINELSYFTDE